MTLRRRVGVVMLALLLSLITITRANVVTQPFPKAWLGPRAHVVLNEHFDWSTYK
jgi:hypothetical protein